jgi:hypothetical protein
MATARRPQPYHVRIGLFVASVSTDTKRGFASSRSRSARARSTSPSSMVTFAAKRMALSVA